MAQPAWVTRTTPLCMVIEPSYLKDGERCQGISSGRQDAICKAPTRSGSMARDSNDLAVRLCLAGDRFRGKGWSWKATEGPKSPKPSVLAARE